MVDGYMLISTLRTYVLRAVYTGSQMSLCDGFVPLLTILSANLTRTSWRDSFQQRSWLSIARAFGVRYCTSTEHCCTTVTTVSFLTLSRLPWRKKTKNEHVDFCPGFEPMTLGRLWRMLEYPVALKLVISACASLELYKSTWMFSDIFDSTWKVQRHCRQHFCTVVAVYQHRWDMFVLCMRTLHIDTWKDVRR